MASAKGSKALKASGTLVNLADGAGDLPLDGFWAFSDSEASWYHEHLSKMLEASDASGVSLGVYGEDGGTSGECVCRWEPSTGFHVIIHSDAMPAMATAPAFFAELMAGGKRWDDKAAFLGFLESAGVYDMTKRTMSQREDEMLGFAIDRQKTLREALELAGACAEPGVGKKAAPSL